jgi:hypothetical protein
MSLCRVALIILAHVVCLLAAGCATSQQNLEQLPISPMLGHPYHSSHGFEPRWGDALTVQTF